MPGKLTKTEKGVLGFFGGLAAFLGIRALVRGGEMPPPGMATLRSKVADAITGKAIQGIEISFNGYAGTTEPNGKCVIENIVPGYYDITFYDPLRRYETLVL